MVKNINCAFIRGFCEYKNIIQYLHICLTFSLKIIDDLYERLDKHLSTADLRPRVAPLEDAQWTYGVTLPYIQNVLRYWKDNYRWNKRQELLNKYPQFLTNIQGGTLYL